MKKEIGDVDVKVTGMGGLINFEVEYIAKCFRDLGYEVVVDNPHADWTGDGPTSKMTLEQKLEIIKQTKPKMPHKIFLAAQHCPWGG